MYGSTLEAKIRTCRGPDAEIVLPQLMRCHSRLWTIADQVGVREWSTAVIRPSCGRVSVVRQSGPGSYGAIGTELKVADDDETAAGSTS